jgi:TatD DNase family protein
MLIDSHCHLSHHKYSKTKDMLIAEAFAEGVTTLIDIGTSIKDNAHVLKSIQQYENVFGTVGIYPHDDKKIALSSLQNKLETQLLKSDKIVGIGECGIDITEWENGRNVTDQLELFEMHLKLAIMHNLPVVIHNRNGDALILNLLEKYKNQVTGVFHCFSSSWDFAKKALDLGFFLSFSGNITYPSNKKYLETVEKVPLDRFLVETDSPYLPPQGHRGEVNEPKYVKIVAEKVAIIKNVSLKLIEDATYKNTCALFKLSL